MISRKHLVQAALGVYEIDVVLTTTIRRPAALWEILR